MSTEIPKQPQAGDQAIHVQPNAASHSLSQEIFANPVDFLTTLKSTLPKANPDDPENVTYRDLQAYASGSGDPRGRAAAAIAVQHWPELRNLSNVLDVNVGNRGAGLSAEELSTDIDFARGTVQKEYLNQVLGSGGQAVIFGAATIGFAAATASTFPIPFLSIPAAGAAGIFGIGFGTEAYDTYRAQQEFDTRVSLDQKMLNSWANIGSNEIKREK